MLYDVAAKQEKELLSLDPLQKAAIPMPEALRFDWQNRRVSEDSLQWSDSGKELLLSVRGDLFLFTLGSGKWDQLTATAEPEHDPKLSPDGARVAFRRGHDLYSMDLASRQTTRLTEDGNPTLLNGELDWVYPEELDLGTAYWWSPDSKHIAYLQLDTAREMIYPQVALTGLRAILEPERYPQAGTPNADVHIGVIPAGGGNTRWMDLGETRGYLIARVYWTPDSSKLAIERFTRVQNELDLTLADSSTGAAKPILHESDPYWINHNDLFHFLKDGRFIWGSERDGFQHLYLYGLDGKPQAHHGRQLGGDQPSGRRRVAPDAVLRIERSQPVGAAALFDQAQRQRPETHQPGRRDARHLDEPQHRILPGYVLEPYAALPSNGAYHRWRGMVGLPRNGSPPD